MSRKIVRIVAAIVFLCGCAFFLYPYFMDRYASYKSDKVMEQFEDDLERLKQSAETEFSQEDGSAAAQESRMLAKLYSDMCAYNERLYVDGQRDLKDPFSYEMPSFDLRDYGFENNVIGIITIPKMDVKLPMYLGANKSNMSLGAVVLGETSMPIGLVNSNVVIAAHRGYKGIKMFRNIQELEVGDKIYISTPWSELEYAVTYIEVVLPSDIDKVLIQEGKDMITLLTCHPYTKNSHRYLVFAERVGDDGTLVSENNADNGDGGNGNESADGSISGDTNGSEVGNINGNTGEKIDGASDSGSDERIDVEDTSDEQIWLETYLPVIGVAVLVVAVIIGMLLTREKKKEK